MSEAIQAFMLAECFSTCCCIHSSDLECLQEICQPLRATTPNSQPYSCSGLPRPVQMSPAGHGLPLQASDSSYLDIAAPTWGLQGPFAFNLWVSQADKTGDGFQYILSSRDPSAGQITDTSVFLPNQAGSTRLKLC